jgi:hypothetical protein
VCESGYCYYDTEAARLAAKADVGILGIDAQIHLQKPQPSIHIPGLNFSDVADTLDSEGNIHVPYLGQYIAALYKFGMAAASAIAVVMIIKKGFDIAISPGGEVKHESYQRIGQIIVGLALVWGSYGLLYAINPQLVAFKVLSINYIQPVPLPMMYMDDAIRGTIKLMDAPEKKITVRTSYNMAAISFRVDELAKEINKHLPVKVTYKPDHRRFSPPTCPKGFPS